ncbi:MAG: L,D-transpeptidase [Anaerolineaceae bacterium]|nr:L,D-transpeptidase [Anaerolineaceae bacterium]
MKRLISLPIFIFLLAIINSPVLASTESDNEPSNEPYAGDVLCLPDAYLTTPDDCLPLGPSTYITSLAEKGIIYPFLPLNGTNPDPILNELEYNIAKVNVFPPETAPIYGTLDDAVGGGTPMNYLPAGELLYVSYTSRADINGGHYVLTGSGGWMRASPAAYMSFQGLIFREQPATSFGWIVEQTSPKITPDYFAAETSIFLPRESIVQIFEVRKVDTLEYYMIGLNQWVERRYIREIIYNPQPPEGVDNNRWIEINLYQQTISIYENNELVFATLIASGVDPYFTRPGLFQIYLKKPTETMSGAFAADLSDYYYLEDVPWTMYFDEKRAIHGAYWRAWLGYPQSHGCVNMSIGDARWIYEWAREGDWVYVVDPSGKTPTDPELYSSGGA